MSSAKLVVNRALVAKIRLLSAAIFTLLILNLSANAQIVTTTTSALDGRTPSALQPGSPAGSYPLSGFDNVNIYNGNLLFRLPLLKVDGRGSAQMKVTLALNVKGWHIKHQHREMPDGNELNTYTPTQQGWSPYSDYGAGRLTGRNYGLQLSQNLTCRWYSKTLSRMTFSTADGTEYELRDQLTNGQPLNSTCTTGANRGTVFVTADGTAATFVSDAAVVDNPAVNSIGPHAFSVSGLLKLRDGTHYRIDSGNITWIRDRNGNKVSFTYATNLMIITDSLNRTITINYNVSDVAPYGLCDQIIFKGFGGAQRIIRVSRTTLSNVLRPGSGYTIRTLGGPAGLFPETNGSSATTHNPTLSSVVWLPDERTYKFYYNSYAELARVELPTGGAFEYDMTPGSGVICPSFCAPDDDRQIYRRVVERRVYANGGTGSSFEGKEVYSTNEVYGSSTSTISVEQSSASGTVLGRSRHFFATSALDSMFGGAVVYAYPAWFEGNETQTEKLDTVGPIGSATVLRRTVTTYAQRTSVSWWPAHAATYGLTVSKEPPNDPRTTQTVTTLEPASANLVSVQTFGYDDSVPFNNQNNVKEYAFGAGVTGILARETRTTYVTSASYTGQTVHIRNLPLQISVHDAGGTERARSVSEYDNYNADSSHAALVNRANVSGFDTAFTNSYITRGNATASTSYMLSGGAVTGSISTFAQYDILGNVVKNIDGRANAMSYFYTDCFGAPNGEAQTSTDPSELGSVTKTFAFPTEVRNALNQSTFTQFEYYLKEPVDVRDPNGTVSSSYFNDTLDRITQVRRGVSSPLENSTTFSYDDPNRIVTSANDRDNNGDGILITKVLFDPLGRSTESQQFEGGTNYIATQTQYDAVGRVSKTSNPFRPWQGQSPVWTTQVFDALGRITSVTTPDNAVVTTSYSGNSATVSDPTGKQRKTVTDSLGRLIQVYEAPNNPSFNHLTDYSYDTLDNLTTVTQGTQTRSRVYDSLNRLTSATNLESGTVTYQYDNANNLVVQTDGRSVSTHFEYDVLNRLTRRWYNGSSSSASTTHNSPALPAAVGTSNEAKLYYDSQTLPVGAPSYSRGSSIGRVVGQTYGAGSNGDYFGYDAFGRLTLKIQQTGAVNYQLSAVYNRANALTSVTQPSGHTISNTYDAAGRLITFGGNLGDGLTRTYSSEIIYSPFGSLAKEKFGTTTSVYNKLFYNVRGQLAEIRESTSYTGPTDTTWNRGAIINHFSDLCGGTCTGSNMTDNNGTLKKQEVYIPHDDLVSNSTMRWQQYDYDPLNRLNWVREISSGGAEQWKQQFSYDRWGNRTINTGVTYGTGINNKAFTADTANNRLGVPGGQPGLMSYDTAGNLTNDTYTGAGNRTYDAENKITSAWGGNNQAQLYAYDANGQRIKRTVNGAETWHVYGLAGELVAEYPANGGAGTPQKEYGYRNGQLLITAEPAGNQALPLFADDFNDNSLDTSKWTITAPGASPTVTEESQQLRMTMAPSTASYNGVSSNSTFDVTGKMVQVEVVQAVSQAGWCENMLELELNPNNYFLIDAGAGSLLMRSRVNGVNDQTIITYDSVAHRHWRIRHNAVANTVNFETSGDGTVWLTRKTVTPGFALTSLRIYLVAGAYGTGNAAPGMAKYDNLKLLSSTAGPSSITVPNSGFETPSLGFGNFQYGPTGGSWNFINGGGISAGGSGFTGGPFVPEGSQIAFVQSNGEFSQSLSGFQANTNYVLTFFAAQRTNCCNAGGQQVAVYLDSTLLGTFNPPVNGVYTEYSTAAFTTTAGSHTLKFVGLNPGGQTGFIDHLRVTGSAVIGNGVQWLVADHLGTPRMILEESGSLAGVNRHDYLPFGEELFAPTGGRTTAHGYAPGDAVRQQFTSEERDIETGLDYFGARYYASTQGRFTSPDDFLNDTNVSDPQSWNLYTYVRNNPLKYIDPTGRIKRDSNGNVIMEARTDNDTAVVTIDGKDYFVYRSVNASGTTQFVLWEVEKVNVFADDGTKIKAYKATGEVQLLDPTKTTANSDGTRTSQAGAFTSPADTQAILGRMAPGAGPFTGKSDCHGTTFASGQVWINDDQVQKLMKGDGYDIRNPSRTPTQGAVGIYSGDGKLATTVHSVVVESVTSGSATVISKGGITNQVTTTPERAWHNPNAKIRYYKKRAQR